MARRPCDGIDYDYYAAPPEEDDELAERELSFVQRFEHLGAKPGVVLLVIGDQFNWKRAFIGGTGQQIPNGIRGETQTSDRYASLP